MTEPQAPPPLQALMIPVTPLQQNCTLLWCTRTMRGAFVDPGGEVERLARAAAEQGVTVEKILLTHGHIDHCGEAAVLARRLGVAIEGPHRADAFWIAMNPAVGAQYGLAHAEAFEPARWLDEGDEVTVGDLVLAVHHTPGHTPGHIVFHHPPSKLALVGDVLFQGSVGRTDFPQGSFDDLVASITGKLWPMGDDTVFIPGHGQAGRLGHERRTNPFVSDRALGRA